MWAQGVRGPKNIVERVVCSATFARLERASERLAAAAAVVIIELTVDAVCARRMHNDVKEQCRWCEAPSDAPPAVWWRGAEIVVRPKAGATGHYTQATAVTYGV